MGLSNELVSKFVKVTKDDVEVKKETTVYGTIVEYNGSKYVKLDGSDLLTPFSSTTDVEPNERVTVMIKNHTAIVTGNVSSPAARTDTVKEVANKITEFNQRMDSVVPYLKKEYAGEILSPDAYNQALKKTETTKQEYNNAAYNHSSRLISQGRQNTNELEDLTQRNNFIEQARKRIQKKENQKKEAVKKLVGVPDKTAVQTVPQNAEKAEKAQIRRQNKQVEDKLATKEKTFAGKSDAEKVSEPEPENPDVV